MILSIFFMGLFAICMSSSVFSIALANSGPLPFHINLGISLSVSTMTFWSCESNCFNPVKQFGENWCLYYVMSSNLWTWQVFPISCLGFLSSIFCNLAHRFGRYSVTLIQKYFLLFGTTINSTQIFVFPIAYFII